jgi:hypothetical protein
MATAVQSSAATDTSFEGIMAAFQKLPVDQRMNIRRYAADSLIGNGADEVGTSDVNHEIVKIYRRLKRWPVSESALVVERILGERSEDDPPGTIRTDEPDRNELSDLADQIEGISYRIAGLVPRRKNMNLSGSMARHVIVQLGTARDILSRVAEIIDGVE